MEEDVCLSVCVFSISVATLAIGRRDAEVIVVACFSRLEC
jgi:hypothetical protein